MLEIERLQLQLPAGFEHRARRISKLLAQQLQIPAPAQNVHLPRLRVGPVRIEADHSDQQVAAAIAGAIQRTVASQTMQGGQQ